MIGDVKSEVEALIPTVPVIPIPDIKTGILEAKAMAIQAVGDAAAELEGMKAEVEGKLADAKAAGEAAVAEAIASLPGL